MPTSARNAYVTLVTNRDYATGALALVRSLRLTARKLISSCCIQAA